jgi:hypothetical protein
MVYPTRWALLISDTAKVETTGGLLEAPRRGWGVPNCMRLGATGERRARVHLVKVWAKGSRKRHTGKDRRMTTTQRRRQT